MGKGNKTIIDSNYGFKERLSACRIRKNLTQEELSEKIGKTPNYISMLETGTRDNPSKEVLESLSRELDVTVEYLLCQTNLSEPSNLHYAADDYIKRDTYLLKNIESAGNKLRFGVVPLYDGIKPKDIELNIQGNMKRVTDYESLERIVTLDDIENISFFDGKCFFKVNNTKCESVIRTVYVNGNEFSTGQFVMWLDNLQSFLDYSVTNISSYTMNHMQADILDEKVSDLIINSRDRCIE